MRATFDLNTNGVLIITADDTERQEIRFRIDTGESEADIEADILQDIVEHSELSYIQPEECGDLTDAPMLGLRDKNGKPTAWWAYMDYQIWTITEELRDYGKVVFREDGPV